MTEGERIIKLETQMYNIEQKVDEGFKRADDRFDSLDRTIKEFINKSDDKFASKWVEKGIWVVATTIIGAIVMGVLNVIKFE